MNVKNAINRWYTPDQLNSDTLFRDMIGNVVEDGSRILDVGAGAGEIFPYDLKERAGEIVGVDMDPRVESNPLLHRGIRCDITHIPIEDNYFDVAFSRYVLEHIVDPNKFIQEMHRVLKPGGRFIFLTPNKWHYVSFGARLTPGWFHRWYNWRLRGRSEKDTFTTVYLLNTASDLRRHFTSAGFEEESLIQRETCPNYLCWSLPTFYLGLAYERLVNSTRHLACFRVNLDWIFRKQGIACFGAKQSIM